MAGLVVEGVQQQWRVQCTTHKRTRLHLSLLYSSFLCSCRSCCSFSPWTTSHLFSCWQSYCLFMYASFKNSKKTKPNLCYMKLCFSSIENPLQAFSLSSMSFQFLPNSLRKLFVLHQQMLLACVHGIDCTLVPQHHFYVSKQQFDDTPQQIF